jgi:hypothetical protein
MKWVFQHTQHNEVTTRVYHFLDQLGETLREALHAGEGLADLLRREGPVPNPGDEG